jgi:hypothetical protein
MEHKSFSSDLLRISLSHVRQRSAANLSLFGLKDNFVFTSILLSFRGAGEVLICDAQFYGCLFPFKAR